MKGAGIMSEWKRNSTTAERLREALDRLNMKQIELSRITNIDKGTISNYLSGKYEPKANSISKIAKALNVSEMWLWGYDVPMKRTEENRKENTTEELSDGERMILELFRAIPDDKKQMAIEMLKAALQAH